jgi:hypothetical protein
MADNSKSESRSVGDARSLPSQERTLALVLNRDLLFGSRIRSALTALGMQGKFVKDGKQFNAELVSNSPEIAIAVIDMNGPVEWGMLRDGLAASEKPPTLAFGPHVDVEGRRAAKLAGIDRIVSNGQFDREMTALIDRYRRR